MAGEPIGQAHRDGADGRKAAADAGTQGSGTDRDALHPADYGSRRDTEAEGAETAEEVQQGGASADDAAGGGRKPTGERDRDYSPDGEGLGDSGPDSARTAV